MGHSFAIHHAIRRSDSYDTFRSAVVRRATRAPSEETLAPCRSVPEEKNNAIADPKQIGNGVSHSRRTTSCDDATEHTQFVGSSRFIAYGNPFFKAPPRTCVSAEGRAADPRKSPHGAAAPGIARLSSAHQFDGALPYLITCLDAH